MRLLPFALSLSMCAFGCIADDAVSIHGAADAAIEPTPTALTACVDNGFTTLWDVSNLHGAIGTMALSADGILAVASLDGSLKQWRVGMSQADAPLPNGRPSYGTTFVDEGERLGAIAFASNSQLLIGGDVSGAIQIWSTVDASLLSSTIVGEMPLVAVAVAPNEDDVVVADETFGGNVRVWSRSQGALSDVLPSELWSVSALAYDGDGGGFVAVGEWYGVYSLEYWRNDDLSAPAHRWTTQDTSLVGAFNAVTFSADGEYVIVAGTNHIMVFDSGDLATGPVAELNVSTGEFNTVLVASGYIITSGGDDMLRVFEHDENAATLVEVASEPVTLPIGVVVDASGKRLLSAGGDGRVRAIGCVN